MEKFTGYRLEDGDEGANEYTVEIDREYHCFRAEYVQAEHGMNLVTLPETTSEYDVTVVYKQSDEIVVDRSGGLAVYSSAGADGKGRHVWRDGDNLWVLIADAEE